MKKVIKVVAKVMMVSFTVLFLFGLYLVYKEVTQPAPIVASVVTPAPEQCQLTTDGILNLINAERTSKSEPILTEDTLLDTVSNDRIDMMIAGKWYGHVAPDGISPTDVMQNHGIYVHFSEDVNSNVNTDAENWTGFKKSPPHYQSLMGTQYSRIGISVRCGIDYVNSDDTRPDDIKAIDGGNITGKTIKSLVVIELI